MLRFSRKSSALIAGSLWLAIGIFLLQLGLRFIYATLKSKPSTFSLIDTVAPIAHGREQGALLLIVLALAVGTLKGKTVLKKAALRQTKRLSSMQAPISLKQLYSPAYYILILGMVALGFLLRFCPTDIRGAIDVAIGCALIQGSLTYFRFKEVCNT